MPIRDVPYWRVHSVWATGSQTSLIFNGSTNACCDIGKGFILIAPARDRLGIGRQCLQTCKRRPFPVHRPQQNGDHTCLPCLMSFQCSLHLDTIAIVPGKEVRTDEQKDHPSAIEVGVNGLSPILTGDDAPIMPGRDELLVLE